MRQGAVEVANVTVDRTECVMRHGQIIHGVVGEQLRRGEYFRLNW